MKLNSTRLSLIAGAVLASGFLTVVPALAHHSFEAEFDGDKTATVTGVVTKIDWTNPHAWVYMNIKDEAGATKTFAVETGSALRSGPQRLEARHGEDRRQRSRCEGAAMAKDGSNRGGSCPPRMMMLAAASG